VPTPAPEDDPTAEPRLSHYRKRINGDHYVLFALEPDAEFSDIRQRAREAQRELEALKARRLSTQQMAQVLTALDKLQKAADVLGHAPKRIVYDANRGNFRGVARCIAAGLTVTELEQFRKAFLATHTGAEGSAQLHATTGGAWESHGQVGMAADEFERALAIDPLNLTFQQRYWALKRRQPGATPRS
jgi:hypothetical protein